MNIRGADDIPNLNSFAIFDDSDLHALFDAAQNSKPEDLKMAADLLRRLKGTNIDG